MKKHIILSLLATALFAAETNEVRSEKGEVRGTNGSPSHLTPLTSHLPVAFDPFTLPDAPPRDLPPSPFRIYTLTNPPVQRILRIVTEYEETVTAIEVQEVWKLEGTNQWKRFKDLPIGVPPVLVSRGSKTNEHACAVNCPHNAR